MLCMTDTRTPPLSLGPRLLACRLGSLRLGSSLSRLATGRGNVFNTERFDLKEFGLQLKFRISGSGKHLYGDGLGLWLTKKDGNPRFEEGPVLGHTDMFTGIGILLDTFRNVESGHVHKDVSLIVSAGTEPVIFDKERPGCDAHYRYFEGREDFDVDNASMIRMWLEKNRVSLEIDRYAKGDWKKCVEVDLAEYKLPANWQDSYHWSISASTGALADNHDVLEFKTASPDKFAHLLKAAEDEGAQPSVQIEVHPKLRADEVGEHVNDLAYEVSDIDKSLRKLSHKMEHDLETGTCGQGCVGRGADWRVAALLLASWHGARTGMVANFGRAL